MKKINPAKTADLNAQFFRLQHQMFVGENFQFFKDFEALIKRHEKSFVVAEKFQNREEGKEMPLQIRKKFGELLLMPDTDKRISMDFTALRLCTAQCEGSILEDNFKKINQAYAPMSNWKAWLIAYALIIEPELGLEHFKFGIEPHVDYNILTTGIYDQWCLMKIKRKNDYYELDAVLVPCYGMTIQEKTVLLYLD
jgi:hypothetical protein